RTFRRRPARSSQSLWISISNRDVSSRFKLTWVAMNERTAQHRPGRKRSEESRLAILTAAFELIGEVGYAGLTGEGIPARSGTGKQPIYRWWPTKADVLLDAMATKADLYVPIPDTGSYAADLRAFLHTSFALARQWPQVTDGLRALMAEAQIDPAF